MPEITVTGTPEDFEELKQMFDAHLERQDRIESKLNEQLENQYRIEAKLDVILETLSRDQDQCQE